MNKYRGRYGAVILGLMSAIVISACHAAGSKGKYNDIYYISRDSKIYNSESNLEIIYMDKVHISEDVSEDVGNLIPLPKSFRQTERYIHLYRAIDYDYYYDHNDIVKCSISGVKQSERTF